MKTEREAAGEEIILEIKQKVLGESYQPLRMWEGEESRILSIGSGGASAGLAQRQQASAVVNYNLSEVCGVCISQCLLLIYCFSVPGTFSVMRSFLIPKLPDAPGLVKHVSVTPAPSVPGPGGSNLLSYVYRLGSSAAAHPDYITLRLLVMLQHGDCHPSNVSIPLQISSFMYEDDYSLLIGFTLAKRTKKRIRNNCICSWKMKTFLL